MSEIPHSLWDLHISGVKFPWPETIGFKKCQVISMQEHLCISEFSVMNLDLLWCQEASTLTVMFIRIHSPRNGVRLKEWIIQLNTFVNGESSFYFPVSLNSCSDSKLQWLTAFLQLEGWREAFISKLVILGKIKFYWYFH